MNRQHLINISFTPHTLYYRQDNYDNDYVIRHPDRVEWDKLTSQEQQPWINLSKYIIQFLSRVII